MLLTKISLQNKFMKDCQMILDVKEATLCNSKTSVIYLSKLISVSHSIRLPSK